MQNNSKLWSHAESAQTNGLIISPEKLICRKTKQEVFLAAVQEAVKHILLRSGSTERNCKKTWCAQKQCAILATDGWWFEKPHVCSEAIHHRREYPADPQERRGQQGPMANDHHHRILCVL